MAVDPIDPRIDPTQRENKPAFWLGYGRYREGVNYTELPKGADYLAGWCYGLTEGRQKGLPKPWRHSKFIWAALAEGTLGGLLVIAPPAIVDGSSLPGWLVIAHAIVVAALRKVTKGPIQ